MILGTPTTHPFFVEAGMLLCIVCAYLGERSIDQWKERTGQAPILNTRANRQLVNRSRLMQELPTAIRYRVRLFQGAGIILLITGFSLSYL
jgi:hypothetical protein